MNQLQQFFYQNKEVRSTLINGQPWFAAKDVCDVLELSNPTVSIQRLDHDEVTKLNLGGLHGETNFVNEYGLYSLILGSRKPEAKQFKRWITHEVIPNIRKHGAYMTPETLNKAYISPEFLIQLATQMKEEQEKNARLAKEIETNAPKVHFAESLIISEDTILIRELAKLLKQKGVDMGERRLYDWLKEEGYLIKRGRDQNRPTQRSMELGLFEVKTGQFSRAGGEVQVTYTTKVTTKGQMYFINKFIKKETIEIAPNH